MDNRPIGSTLRESREHESGWGRRAVIEQHREARGQACEDIEVGIFCDHGEAGGAGQDGGDGVADQFLPVGRRRDGLCPAGDGACRAPGQGSRRQPVRVGRDEYLGRIDAGYRALDGSDDARGAGVAGVQPSNEPGQLGTRGRSDECVGERASSTRGRGGLRWVSALMNTLVSSNTGPLGSVAPRRGRSARSR